MAGWRDDGFDDEILGKAWDARLVRRLRSRVRPYFGLVGLGIGALLLYSFLDVAAPLLVREAVNGPISAAVEGDLPLSEAFDRLARLASLLLGVIVFGFAARAAHIQIVEYVGQRVMVDVRRELFAKIQQLALRFFDRNPVGRLVTRVVSDVEALYEALSSGIAAIFGDFVKVAAIVVIMLAVNPILALWLFSVFPVLFLVSLWFRRRARDGYRAVRRDLARTNAWLQESITGVRIIQAFGQEARSRERFAERNGALAEAHRKTVWHFSWYVPAVEILFAAAQALLVYVGAVHVMKESLPPGDFLLFWFYLTLIFDPIRDLSQQYNLLQSAMAAGERIFEILDETEEVPNPASPAALPAESMRGEIEFERVWFAYRGEDWVLKDVSFRIAPGESVALVGATGAGKTSIISLVSRLYDVDRGRVLVDGRDVREYDKHELRRRIAVVLQDPFLFAGDVMENIRLSHPEIPEQQAIAAAKAVNADAFIRRLPGEYRAPVVERGATLSTGQKQLLAFARALAFDPRILVLDEATSSIDVEAERLIEKALETLLSGRTSIVIAHRLSTIKRCDRILVMHHGELKEEGTHRELLARRGIYRRLYDLQYGRPAAG